LRKIIYINEKYMKKNKLIFILFFIMTLNINAEENILNRFFFGDFIKTGHVLIENSAVACISLTGIGALTIALMNNDLMIKNYFIQSRSEFADKTFDIFNITGDGIVVLAANSFLFLLGEKEKKTAEKVIEAVAIAGATSYILKIVTGRQRPSDTDERYAFSPFSFKDSFPSGHTTVAFAWASVIAENYGIWYITYPVAALCGIARIYKNMHWASDVFIGSIIGIFFGKLVSSDENSDIYMSAKTEIDASILLVNVRY